MPPIRSALILILGALLLVLSACETGPGPAPTAVPAPTQPPPGTVAPPATPEPTQPPAPTATGEQSLLKTAQENTKRLAYYHAHLEVRGAGERDLTLDMDFQAPARAVLTLTTATGVITPARAINGTVFWPDATGAWVPLPTDDDATSLIPTALSVLRLFNPARTYGAIFLGAPYHVQRQGQQAFDGLTLDRYSFDCDDLLQYRIGADSLGGLPVTAGTVSIDPATQLVRQLAVTMRVGAVQPVAFPSPTPGGPPATPRPGAIERLPATITLHYDLTAPNVPVEVANPPGVDAPTYPPGPHPIP